MQGVIEQEYTIEGVLGRGAFSIVKQCVHKRTGEIRAVKIVDKTRLGNTKNIENEIKILQQIGDHPNIIQLHEVFEDSQKLYLVMELVKGGELFGEVIQHGPFDESRVFKIFMQIVEAVKYLHSNHITHRDLKLENILITSNMEVKLTDFGLSKLGLSDHEMMQTRCGTPMYVSPEILRGDKYDHRVDLWSLGVVLYILLHCSYPFMADSLNEIYAKIEEEELEFPEDAPRYSLCPEVKDLITSLLQCDPKSRISLEEISTHPWVRKFVLQSSGGTS